MHYLYSMVSNAKISANENKKKWNRKKREKRQKVKNFIDSFSQLITVKMPEVIQKH